MRPFITFIFLSLTLQTAFAEQELETIVRETKFNSSSRIVIDKEEIEKSHAKNLTSLLAVQANISIAQSNFTPTSLYLRGGDSSHVLILVDGVPFYDASTIQRTINLNSLDIKSVQRIEVIKGSQSVLYGGQALSGVIKIDTIPQEMKTSGQVLVQDGSFNQRNAAVGGLLALSENTGVVVRGSYSDKQSLSPILTSTKLYPTRLGTAEAAFVHHAYVNSILKVQTSYDRTFIPTTAFPAYSPADTDDFITSTYQLNATGILSAPQFFLKPLLSVSAQQSARQFEQDDIASGGFPTKQDYKGELLAVRLDLTLLDTTSFNIKAGASFNQEKLVYRDKDILKADEKDEFEGVYAKLEVPLSQYVTLEAGERYDYHRGKDVIFTMQRGLTLFEFIKLEYATGFKQPSLYQLYSDYGNINIKPEKSTSYSLTVEKNITENYFASMTIFDNKFENLIVAKGTPLRYENISSTKSQGVELLTSYRWLEQGVHVALTLGYQEPKDLDQNNWLVRRPLRTAGFKIRKDFTKVSLGVEALHNGDRRDRIGSTSYGTLKPYTLFHGTVEFKPIENIALFARVQNIFNQRYESSYGFYDEGLNANLGAEFSF